MNEKLDYWTIQNPIYKTKTHVVLGQTPKQFAITLQLPPEEVEPHDGYLATTYKVKDGYVAIRFDEKNPSPGIIAHEAFHAAGFILEMAGIKASHEDDEAKAYLLEYMVTQIHEIINELKEEQQ